MPRKASAKAAINAAVKADTRQRKAFAINDKSTLSTVDSFSNFAHKLGLGADNPLSGASYGFNPITRNRILLEWIHRGSWIGGVAVDLVANDMTRAGIEYKTELPPDDSERLDNRATVLQIWTKVNEVIKWSRLYGGALGVLLIDGQDPRTPLNMDTVGPNQFAGILPLDRWMVEPSIEDLVTEYGPNLGKPRYYRAMSNAPALRNMPIHYSRVLRMEGIQLPYHQQLTENLWGMSVLERLYDRLVAFDSATTGAAQLVYKSYLRTLKVKDLRQLVAAGGPAMTGLSAYVDMMRRFQGIEGMTMIDSEDEFEIQGHQAFSGLSDALVQFGQQLSGALQIPLVRLFGQSPAGLNSTGESDLRMFYDHIKQEQVKHLLIPLTKVYRCIAQSEGIELPPNFTLEFRSLWEMTETDKANIAKTTSETVSSAKDSGLISDKVALQELRQSSRTTGIFTNITEDLIAQADDQVQPPVDENAMAGLMGGDPNDPNAPPPGGMPGGQPNEEEVRPQGQAGGMDVRPPQRKQLQQPPAGGGQTGGPDHQRPIAKRPTGRP